MVRLERFELPTAWFEAKYSDPLSYRRTNVRYFPPEGVTRLGARRLPGICKRPAARPLVPISGLSTSGLVTRATLVTGCSGRIRTRDISINSRAFHH